VQVDPTRPPLKALGTKSLKVKCHELLSKFAFKSNLRHYTAVRCVAFDNDGAFGFSATQIPVTASPDIGATVDKVFVDGDHTEHIQVGRRQ